MTKKTLLVSALLLFLLAACQTNNQSSYQTQEITLHNGDTFQLGAGLKDQMIGGVKIKQFLYNDQFPGPRFRLTQGSTVYINFTNNLDEPTTIHWHGIRLENSNDGIADVTQPPINPGESFLYTLSVPDSGIFWYHPHMREDKQQELGLYGNIIVEDTAPPVNREEFLLLDDMLLGARGTYPFGNDQITHALMGRFGNVLLVNGKEKYDLKVDKGEVIRFYFTNAANTRVFRIEVPGVKFKLTGSDLSDYEKQEFVNAITVSPGERYIVDAYFENAGKFLLKNTNPIKSYELGSITVKENQVQNDFSAQFSSLMENKEVQEEVDSLRKYFNKSIDVDLLLTAQLGHAMNMHHHGEEGIEWEDEMAEMNQMMGSNMVKWRIVNQKTGKSDDVLQFKVGDKIRMRVTNDHNSPHAMQHPFHLHGQRFLVLAINGVKTSNFVWKDTVLVPADAKVDLLVDITNPGSWMMHCHIPEHLHTGMMMMFDVV